MRTRSADYLLNEAASVLAEVRAHIWDGDSLPVPIDAIAESHFGLLIREVADIAAELPELGAAGGGSMRISGAIVPDRAEILVDATEASRWPQRRRYTIAHELGHWVLHRGPEQVLCRESGVEPAETLLGGRHVDAGLSPRPDSPAAGIEWEANVFGGALLLPPWLVRREWERHRDPHHLARVFDVSDSAFGGRWEYHRDFARWP